MKMNSTIDILRAELERLFSLDEMTSMSRRLLGLDPQDVGGLTAKGSFARALTERCFEGDRLDALVDVILASRQAVDPRVRDASRLIGEEEIEQGDKFGPFLILKKLGDSEQSIVYSAMREEERCVLKVLRREACRDRRLVQRYLTANRMVAEVDHPGLPQDLKAGEVDGKFWVSYTEIDGEPLSARFIRTGRSRFDEIEPILRGILLPLAALHSARVVHGDLKLENVLVGDDGAGDLAVTLIDFGAERLRHRVVATNGHAGVLAVFGSPKTIAPEQVRGQRADAASDIYAFGAMMYELLAGKPVFTSETATDAAFAHVTRAPEPPSAKAPRGWISEGVDRFVLTLLAKDREKRPRDAAAVLVALESLESHAVPMTVSGDFSEEKLSTLADLLIAAPFDSETAVALERAVSEGADPVRVAESFEAAAVAADGEDDDSRELKKSLLYRAARIFESAAGDKVRAEKTYAEIVELDPNDEIAQMALDELRKALGRHADVVESLLARTETAEPGRERARLFAEIGRLCATALDDPDQGILAYARALCETPGDRKLVDEIERLAEGKAPLWNEVLTTVVEGIQNTSLSTAERGDLLTCAGRWYEQKLGRPDLGLLAYQQILGADPANEGAYEGMANIYRKAQQWPELVNVLVARADAATSSPRARDLRAEAAETLELKLSDSTRSRELYVSVLSDDPGHEKAADGLARISERTGDYQTLVAILQKRAETLRGREEADALLKVAGVYEDRLEDMIQAARHFEMVLAIEPQDIEALRGLDRIYNRTGKYRELLDNLQRQLAAAATPRQKITLYERMATLHDEEFLDHARAADCLEEILVIDPTNDTALTMLPRHYRAKARWEKLEELYERHAAATVDDARRVDLMMHHANVLAEHIGSPERATRVYEQVLTLRPGHPAALEALARLREQAGDIQAALSAVEALAEAGETGEARAEQWIRAARLLEAHGDRDGAIERYKLAVEASPGDAAAAGELRKAYTLRGDAASVVTLIEQELDHAEGKVATARLHAELARVQHEKLHQNDEAEQNAKLAMELDPTSDDALLVLGDLAFERGRYVEATKYMESLVGRASALPKEDAVRAIVRFVEAFGQTLASSSSSTLKDRDSSPGSIGDSNPRLATAVQALDEIAPGDAEALARVGRVLFDCGDTRGARRSFERLLDKHQAEMSHIERADAQWRLGECLRRLGELDQAVDLLREAGDADPSNPSSLNALAKVYEQTGDWEEYVRTKRRRLEVATSDERFDLLLEIGDAEFAKLKQRARASKTFVAALEERPDDRGLLTKLMQLYSEEKDWAKLVEVVLRLADFVEDSRQRAKYMHTAAIVTSRQLGETEQALAYYERALEFDPALVKAAEEAIELRSQLGDSEGVERLLKMQLDQAKQTQDRPKIVLVLDRLGELYRKLLNEPELAIDAYEAAQAFDPEGKERGEVLAELYASDVTQYLEKAVRAQAQMLRTNPYRVSSYKLLRRLFTEARRPDPAWCLCQVLVVLNLADPDEDRFYRRHRSENAAPAQEILDEDDWGRYLSHEDADPLVTRIFALIQPTIIRARTQPLAALGYDERFRLNLAEQPYAVLQMLYYAQGVFGFEAPPVYQNPNDPAGLGFLHAHTPSIVLGIAAFESSVPSQSLAFVAGRHMTYFRPGYYVRHLVPTGTGLKAWLFAAIKLCVPQFPVAPDLQGQVGEALRLMTTDFQGTNRELLASMVSKLLQSGGAIDLKKWVAAIDLTADRAGFLLAHDLAVATEVMRATDEAASVSSKERVKEIVLYSISAEYFALREKLQITVES
jgi:tetratricopeptide (TPR) repeat protein/tRNA A-37 threonylcarbamoyl transferase component Bud32